MIDIRINDAIKFVYTNWKGETSKHRAVVEEFVFGSNQWNKEPQFLIKAFDLDKSEMRLFATKDISQLKVC